MRSKKVELEKALSDLKPEVVAIQETKLRTDDVFQIRGYHVVRKDRTTGRRVDSATGGGVATLIREGTPYTRIDRRTTASTDTTTDAVLVEIGGDHHLQILNIYVPPIRSAAGDDRVQNFSPDPWPTTRNTVICGDVNGHSNTWDPYVAEDSIGESVDDWASSNNFIAANTGAPTRQSRAPPYGLSAPDITMHHASLANRVEWETLTALASDHFPILCTISRGRKKPGQRKKTKFSYKKADWTLFERKTEEACGTLPTWTEDTTIKEANQSLVSIITAAANAAIPRGARRDPKAWWSEEVQEAVEERDRLRARARIDPTAGDEWRRAEKATKDVITKARQDSWRDFASGLSLKTDATELWRTIHSIDGRTPTTRRDDAYLLGKKTLSRDRAKADAFMRTYAQISHLPPRVREDRPIKHRLTTFLRTPCTQCGHRRETCCAPFTRTELDHELGGLPSRRATGLDKVANEMLQHLGEIGRDRLLDLVNMSWLRCEVPSAWTKAEIVPILKRGKPPEKIESHRPISLLSCVSKLCERLVNRRLVYLLENRRLLNPNQAGFRRRRSTEDQILRVTQAVADGLQGRKRTVMVLVDFSRAYDKTWRTGLLFKMAELGLPRCYTAWFKAFLTDRKACVRINDTRGGFRILRDGTPQGAVTSPALFNIYINDVTDNFPSGVETSMFADDLAIWSSHQNITEAEGKLQQALDSLAAWAEKWKLTVSLEKTVSTIFSLDPAETRREANLSFRNHRLTHNPRPTFLGVTLDRTLTFNEHAKTVKGRMKARNNVLRAISGTTWGCAASDLRSAYMAFSRACADYAAGAWMPGVSATTLESLEVAQRQACRTITGCLKSTPVGALTREADLLPFNIRRRLLAATAVEKHMRDIPNDPVQRMLQPGSRPRGRLKHDRGWARTGLETGAAAGLSDLPREPLLITASTAPWEPATPNVHIHTGLVRTALKTAPPEERRRAAEETLSQLPAADVTVFTDGSAKAGTENGGAGAIVWSGGREETRIQAAAGRYTSSYVAELHALNEAAKYLEGAYPAAGPSLNIRICTDSQSALRRLSDGPAQQTERLPDEVWTRLIGIGRHHRVDLQWVPGHAGIPGNEAADEVAGQAADLPQDQVPVTYGAARARLKHHLGREWIASNRHTRHFEVVGQARIKMGDRIGLSRKESVELARLRTGHSTLLRAYRHRIGLDDDPNCTDCDNGEPEDASHLLTSCPAGALARHQTFGRSDPTLKEVLADVDRALSFLRRLGRL